MLNGGIDDRGSVDGCTLLDSSSVLSPSAFTLEVPSGRVVMSRRGDTNALVMRDDDNGSSFGKLTLVGLK
jgi:hypothetical protein